MASSFLVYIPFEEGDNEEGDNEEGDDDYDVSEKQPSLTNNQENSSFNAKSSLIDIPRSSSDVRVTDVSPGQGDDSVDDTNLSLETDSLLSKKNNVDSVGRNNASNTVPDEGKLQNTDSNGVQTVVKKSKEKSLRFNIKIPDDESKNGVQNDLYKSSPEYSENTSPKDRSGRKLSERRKSNISDIIIPVPMVPMAKAGRFEVTTLPVSESGENSQPGTSIRRGSRDNVLDDIRGKDLSTINDMSDMTAEITVMTMRKYLQELLKGLNIDNDVWKKTDDGNEWQINFVVEASRCDSVLQCITKAGYGRIAETSVSVFPASLHHAGLTSNVMTDASNEKLKIENREKKEFIKSIKSRLTVAQVVGAVKSNATLTFDFLVLILLASIIAGLGLAESSSVSLVASMLISPLMGPIIGFTFGIVVKNGDLWKLGFRNELIGLSICLSYGFLFGLLTGAINNTGANWGASDRWPTPEMKARGMFRSLWVGVLIALPSGAGVALSILGGNTGSLVGVAISASLLPPAVNAGMLWGLAVVSAVSPPPYALTVGNITSLNCPPLKDNEYEFAYYCSMPLEAAVLGSVSLLLTILNIICIFIMGIIVLKIKEIAPHTAMSPAMEAFWKKDLPIVRNNYRTTKGPEAVGLASLAKQICNELRAKNLNEAEIEKLKNDPDIGEVTAQTMTQGPNLLNHVSLANQKRPTHLFSRTDYDPTENDHQVDERYLTIANGAAAKEWLKSANKEEVKELFDGVNKSPDSHGHSVVRYRRHKSSMTPMVMSPGLEPFSPLPQDDLEDIVTVFNVQYLQHRPKSHRRSDGHHHADRRFLSRHSRLLNERIGGENRDVQESQPTDNSAEAI